VSRSDSKTHMAECAASVAEHSLVGTGGAARTPTAPLHDLPTPSTRFLHQPFSRPLPTGTCAIVTAIPPPHLNPLAGATARAAFRPIPPEHSRAVLLAAL